MNRTSHSSEQIRRDTVLKILTKLYPDAATELVFGSDFELLIAVVLSAQCTDKKVNEVTPELFRRYSSPDRLSRARLATIEKIIRPINYYKTKAKHLLNLAKGLVTQHDCKIPKTHEELIRLAGVGNKTANVVLSELGLANTFPVDTHVFRVSRRLGLAEGKTREDVERSLKQRISQIYWRKLHHQLILHGRRVCTAQRPRCISCALAQNCSQRIRN
jgi:endonuclease-3